MFYRDVHFPKKPRAYSTRQPPPTNKDMSDTGIEKNGWGNQRLGIMQTERW